MARKRMIDPSLWDDEDVGVLTDGAFRCFVALISNADDHGKIEINPRRMKGYAFRYRDDVTVDDVSEYMDELDTALRSVVFYEMDGKRYVKLMNWHKYQTVRKPQLSRIPDPVKPQCVISDAPVTHEENTSADERNGIEGEGEGKEKGIARDTSSDDNTGDSLQDSELRALLFDEHHPFVLAYRIVCKNGGPLSEYALRSPYAKFLELDLANHPAYVKSCTGRRAEKLFEELIQDRPELKKKSLAYILPVVKDRLDEIADAEGIDL
ncbi:MAG: hypothetical protein ABFD49_11840 [Armatimonadota bacterium]|nr:hypothetical protein [bacterium]